MIVDVMYFHLIVQETEFRFLLQKAFSKLASAVGASAATTHAMDKLMDATGLTTMVKHINCVFNQSNCLQGQGSVELQQRDFLVFDAVMTRAVCVMGMTTTHGIMMSIMEDEV